MTPRNAEFNGEFKEIRLKMEIEVKITEKTKKQHIWKAKFLLITKNFTIFQEKIHSITIEMTSTNAQFSSEFNEIRLNIEIEAKIGEKGKQEAHLEGKICLNYKKFHNFTRESSLNQNSNDIEKCRIEWWIQRYCSKDRNRNENWRTKETKETNERQNLS